MCIIHIHIHPSTDRPTRSTPTPSSHPHSFCGWPTALYLSEQGHDVIVLDNLSRRDIDNELGCQSLTPIATPEVRVRTWEQVSGRTMRFVNLDVAKDFAELVQVCRGMRAFACVFVWGWWWWLLGGGGVDSSFIYGWTNPPRRHGAID